MDRILLARELQRLGLSSEEIGLVLRRGDHGERACADRPSAFDAALSRVEERLAELRRMRRRLLDAARDCREGRCLLAPGGGGAV